MSFKQTCIKFIFGLLIVATVFPAIMARTNSYGLSLRVFDIEEGRAGHRQSISITEADVINLKTKKRQSFSSQADAPFLADLNRGDYKVTVAKNGYKTTHKQIALNCSYANSENIISEVVFLWKGNVAEVVEMNPSVLGIVGHSASFEKQQVEAQAQSQQTVNGKATFLVQPLYPFVAKATRASGAVGVRVVINEIGEVVFAQAESGHLLLRASAVAAARSSQFSPTLLNGMPVKIAGIIVYDFLAQ